MALTAPRGRQQAGDEEDEAGQDEADQAPGLHVYGFGEPVMHAGEKVRAHLQHEQGQGRHARDQDGAAQVADLGGAGGLFAVARVGVALFRVFQPIARLLHGGGQIAEGHSAGEEADGSPLGGQVDVGFGHAGHGANGLLDPADTAGAGHAEDRQVEDFQGGGGHRRSLSSFTA